MEGPNFKEALDRLTSTVIVHNDSIIDPGELQNDEEIMRLMDLAYQMADEVSPTGQRTPSDIDMIELKRKQLEEELRQRTKEEKDDQKLRDDWQYWAQREREKTELSLNREQLKRFKEAVKNPRVKDLLLKPKVQDLLLKIMRRQMTPEQAFGAVTKDPDLKKQMMGLIYQGTKKGGKSRVFRRKNKKMTSTSRRKVRGTRRHRKSYSRRSTRR